MNRSSEAAARIRAIEAQQDEVLRQLVELELRTETVLAEHTPTGSIAEIGDRTDGSAGPSLCSRPSAPQD